MNPVLKLAYAVVPLHSDLRFALLLQHFLVVAVSETILLAVLVGKLQEYLSQLRVNVAEVAKDCSILGIQEFDELIDTAHMLGSGSNLSTHVLGNASCFTWSIVVLRHLVVTEYLQSGITVNRVFAASFFAGLSTIDLWMKNNCKIINWLKCNESRAPIFTLANLIGGSSSLIISAALAYSGFRRLQ